MKSDWKKTSISLTHDMGNGKSRKRSYNGLNQAATDEKIAAFGDVIAQLSGEPVEEITVSRAEVVIKEEPAPQA